MQRIQKPELISWLARRRWWIISGIIIGLMIFEVWEDQSNPSTFYHLFELFLYVIFLSTSGILIGALIRSIQKQNKYLRILDIKHKISLDLASSDDWDTLVKQVVAFPARIAAVEMSSLYLQNPVSHEFLEIGRWAQPGTKAGAQPILARCQACLNRQGGKGYVFSICDPEDPAPRRFCLPVISGAELVAQLHFQTREVSRLTQEQKFLFENIGDEIAVALKAGHDRRVMREISDAEISLNERRKVSYILHDNLAQNLGYLRLKLGQILSEKDRLGPEPFENDLESMQNVANESYDTVRGILETLTPLSQPGFGSTLSELARKVGQRAHLEIGFQSTGQALELPMVTSQALLYAFQEVLSNIEKHAHATRTDILVAWKDEGVVIRVADNGVGFHPEKVDIGRHFGLGILHERITAINGQIEISSREMIGTTVVISAPLRQSQFQR